MGTVGRRLIVVAFAISLPVGVAQSPSPIEIVSVATGGAAAAGRSGSSPFAPVPPRGKVSADGRYVVFESEANNLSALDTNFATDVFVRDRQLGVTTLVSVAADGSAGNGRSLDPVISGDGRYVAFVSAATNLVPGDTNEFNDVFLRDLAAGVTTRLSVASTGEQSDSLSQAPAINGDGRYVAFHSGGSNLVPGDTNNTHDVFVRDVLLGVTERVSIRTDGAQGFCCASVLPTITADGRHVAFVSQNQLDTAHPNSTQEVFVRDRQLHTTTLVSLTAGGGLSNTGAIYASISADGRFLAWQSTSTNIVTPDRNGLGHDIFHRNLESGAVEMVSVASDGTQGNHDSWMPAISGDGRYVVFHSLANNLVAGDTNAFSGHDVFLRDTQGGVTLRVNTGVDGAEADGTSDSASISVDGRLIYFQSTATNLVAGHTGSHQHVFVYASPLARLADLSLALAASATQPAPGSSITLTITAANGGPDDVGDVMVRVPLPPGVTYVSDSGGGTYTSATGVWSVGSVANGTSASLDLVVQVTATAAVTVTAQISASPVTDPDSTPDNDDPEEDDQRSVVLTPGVADLSMGLAANIANPPFNSNVTFTVSLTNSGPGLASGVRARVLLPAGLVFVAATPAAAYDAGSGVWTPGVLPAGVSIPSGATLSLQIVGRVTSLAPLEVMAEVISAGQPDPDSAPDNGVAAEDDYAAALITAMAGPIVVNSAAMVRDTDDGTCTLAEAIVAANTDLPSGNEPGECAGGSGADVIELRARHAPKDAAGVRDEYRVAAVDNTIEGPTGLPAIASVMTIDGRGAVIARAGDDAFRLLLVLPGAVLTLNDVAISGGLVPAYGGALVNRGALTITNGLFTRNEAGCDGGAIMSFAPLTIRASIFESNHAGCSGGAIETFYAGPVRIDDTTVRRNTAPHGSGGGVMFHGTTTAALSNVTIESNVAKFDGGGVLAHNADAHVSFVDSRISGNAVTAGYGGGVANGRLTPGDQWRLLVPGGTMSMTNTILSGNTASGGTGGGMVNTGPLTVRSSTISDNRVPPPWAGCGGGIFSVGAVELSDTQIRNNSAEVGAGGGICATDATVMLDNVLLEQNRAGTGGGVWRQRGTTELRNNTRLLNNTAGGAGGGMFLNDSGALTFSMTTGAMAGNTAHGQWFHSGGGGGLTNANTDSASSVVLTDVAVRDNRAANGGDGGGIFNRGRLTMIGGVLAGNIALSGGGLANGTGALTGGVVTLTNTVVEHNTAASLGGGVFNALGAPAATIEITGASVRNNRAHNGGGIHSWGTLTASGATIAANTAEVGGGVSASGQTAIAASTLNGNAAVRAGGAVLNASGTLTISGSELNDNSAETGGGVANGTLDAEAGSVILTNVTMQNNRAASSGGAIFAGDRPVRPGSVTVAGSLLRNNRAQQAGGAIFGRPHGLIDVQAGTVITGNVAGFGGGIHASGSLLVSQATLSANGASTGGAIFVEDFASIAGTTIERNTARQGGGIAVFGGFLSVTGGSLTANVADGPWFLGGGGGGLAAAGTATLTGVAVSNNRAEGEGDGGGILNGGQLTMIGGTLSGNAALSGGGLASGNAAYPGGTVSVTNVTVEDNVAAMFGGGLFTPTGTITVADAGVRNNRARDGGGIHSGGALTVARSTIVNNAAGYAGGIVAIGSTRIASSTLSGNTADRIGGLGVMPGGFVWLDNSTVSGNTATTLALPSGGGLEVLGDLQIHASTIVDNTGPVGGILNDGRVVVTGSIVAGNRRGDGAPGECLTGAGAGGFARWTFSTNLVGEDAACPVAVNLNATRLVAPDAVFADVLGPLADNGGGTPTHAPLPGSFAVDGYEASPGPVLGTACSPADQRGEPRPRDGDGDGLARCDFGAFEQQAPLTSPAATIASLSPAAVKGGAAGATVEVIGSRFMSDAMALVSGLSRHTVVVSPSRLLVTLEASDLAVGFDVRTLMITVRNPGTALSNAVALPVVSAHVALVQSGAAAVDAVARAAILPGMPGQAGLAATLTNNDPSSSTATVTVATYAVNPIGGNLVAAGGLFDLQVNGADASDLVAAAFYYPNTVVDSQESNLRLWFWSGTGWAAVRSSGHALPATDITDNLDGTVSGGRFAVVFDHTSVPQVTQLGGTMFALGVPLDTNPPVTVATRDANPTVAGWNNNTVVVTLTATDDSGVEHTEFDLDGEGWRPYIAPIAIVAEGVHTVRYRSRDAVGNVEPVRTQTIRIDKTAPSLTVTAKPAVLWPPTHKLIDVSLKVRLTDALAGADGFTLVSVKSSEPDDGRGDGHTTADMRGWSVGTADTRGRLRAERSQKGPGRDYTLTYQGKDRAGNVATATVVVTVPHDRRRR